MSRDIGLISSFVRFVEFMNHVKRSQPPSSLARKGGSGGTPQPPKLVSQQTERGNMETHEIIICLFSASSLLVACLAHDAS